MNKFFCNALFPALSLIAMFSCKPWHEDRGAIFNTLYEIKYQSNELLSDKISASFREFSLSLNPFNPNSIITKINRNEDVEADNMFIAVFNRANEISELSGGAFDGTVSPLINLWGFGFKNADSVSQPKIDSIMAFVGYNKIRLDGKRAVKDDPRVELNFSAIAKGFASDVIGALLEREGVENYMINIGGEVAVKGVNPNNNCWSIGINKPEDDNEGMTNEIEHIVKLCDKSGLATSGNYRNYYIRDGKKYAHTIDPKTGYPSGNSMLSATIIAADCMTADALATACMALGEERALNMLSKLPDIRYFLIIADETKPTGYRTVQK
ncbi:MAG: FAD:protein FMN transferase [Tannerella sp.]|jgi:thiamine biosynthesis lipoprotein|nr:FAD:protein FMN transferase [Tannerella sp.]